MGIADLTLAYRIKYGMNVCNLASKDAPLIVIGLLIDVNVNLVLLETSETNVSSNVEKINS